MIFVVVVMGHIFLLLHMPSNKFVHCERLWILPCWILDILVSLQKFLSFLRDTVIWKQWSPSVLILLLFSGFQAAFILSTAAKLILSNLLWIMYFLFQLENSIRYNALQSIWWSFPRLDFFTWMQWSEFYWTSFADLQGLGPDIFWSHYSTCCIVIFISYCNENAAKQNWNIRYYISTNSPGVFDWVRQTLNLLPPVMLHLSI